MKFEEAVKKMEELAQGKCFSLQIDYLKHSSNIVEVEYGVYIENFQFQLGKTWEEAIDKLENEINPKPTDFSGIPQEIEVKSENNC